MKIIIKSSAVLFAATTVAVFMASCQKETIDIDPTKIIGVERYITTTAAIPQDGDKAYLDYADGRKVKWELTDALNINGTNVALSSLNADAITARFEGTTYAIPSGGNDVYWAVYPTAIVGTASGSTIPSNFTASTLTVNFPSTQTYNSSANALNGNTLMAGYASVPAGDEDILFQMRNLGTVLKLTLKADASATNKFASRIEFTTTNGALAGAFSVSNGSTPTVTPTVNVTKVLTVNLTDGNNNYIDLSTPKDIYVILPPLASKNLTMTIYNTDNKQTNKTMASATLERNKIYTNTINDLCFCECGGGTPYFSINDSQQVVFAPGNLQYRASTGTWRFAEHQWDIIGAANSNISPSYSGWIDLFGWGTSGYDNTANDPWAINYQPWASSSGRVFAVHDSLCPNDYGYGPSLNMPDPDLIGTSANYDWGVYNAIYNPRTNTTDPAGTWRTLSQEEVKVIFTTRRTCSIVRYAYATVNGVTGIILTPDNWNDNTYTFNKANPTGNGYGYGDNTVTALDWTNILEPAGCVFLPSAGYRNGTTVNDVGLAGHYWEVTRSPSGMVYPNGWGLDKWSRMLFVKPTWAVAIGNDDYRYIGNSVRLVKVVK